MDVKFYFLSLAAALTCVSCVDSSYDLANIGTDNIVIGSDESVFTVPIATITISKEDFDSYLASSGSGELKVVTRSDSSLSFTEMVDLVNALLPSGEEVDIDKLTSEEGTVGEVYTSYLTDLLIYELQNDESKREEFAQALVDNQETLTDEQTTDVYNALGIEEEDYDENGNLSLDVVNSKLTETLEDDDLVNELKSSINTAVADNVITQLADNKNTSIEQSIDSVELPTDVIDMLTGSGRIEMIATYSHDFPFTFDLEDLKLSSSSYTQEFPVTNSLSEDEDPRVIDLDELAEILNEGATLESAITLKTFASTGSTGSALKIKLVAKKYGGIEL